MLLPTENYPSAIRNSCRQLPGTLRSVLPVQSSLQLLPIKLLLSSQESAQTQLPLETRRRHHHRLRLALITLKRKVSRPHRVMGALRIT